MGSPFILEKMHVTNRQPDTTTITYTLSNGQCLNDFLNQKIHIYHTGNKQCLVCGRKIKKTFFQGFCFPCFQSSPQASECIIRPKLCQAHLGLGRDKAWEEQHHNQPHIVYLAVSSGLKVGVTCCTNIPSRWIDQGANSAIIFAEVPYRYAAGCIEVALKDHVSDRTSWQKMLKNNIPDIDLITEKKRLLQYIPKEFQCYISNNNTRHQFKYPILNYPKKVKSISFDKHPTVDGVLTGIKGQYLLFDDDRVLNIRRHGGYEVVMSHH
jgi:hypothetical protein